jgi:hypothetical protein
VKPDIEVDADPVGGDAANAAPRSPIGDLREEDLPGAIGNPTDGGSDDSDALKKINKTPTIRPDLSAINPEKEDIQVWESKDAQFRRAFDLLKTFSVFKPSQAPTT